jgi:hypothetical protein
MENNSLLKKIIISLINKQQLYLVRVCAWCPKDKYPKLHMWQKYTHGICHKHYRLLSKKNVPPTLQEQADKLLTILFPKRVMNY